MVYTSWRRSLFIYLGLSLLAFLLIVSSSSRAVLVFKDVENTVFYPFHFLVRGLGHKVAGMAHVFQEKESEEVQLEKLKAEVETYKQTIINLNALKEDNDRLRSLLELKKSPEYDAIAAEVIGRDFIYGYSYVTLNKGRIDGISNNLPVVAFIGTTKAVVGVVSEANLMTSKIRTLKSELSGIGVYLPRTNTQSVVEGLGGTAKDIQLLYIDKSDSVEKGDLVYTSNESELFPQNLLVGTIDTVDNTNKTSTTYQIYLTPAVSFNKIREVFVLRPRSRK